MRQWEIGRVTLALTLIFIGISTLFSLFYDSNFLYWTIKFSPIVIIILGIEILISAFFSSNERIKIKIDVASIILTVIFLGVYTAIVIGTHFVKNFNEFQHFGVNFSNYDYSKTVEKKFFIKAINEFELENRYSGDM